MPRADRRDRMVTVTGLDSIDEWIEKGLEEHWEGMNDLDRMKAAAFWAADEFDRVASDTEFQTTIKLNRASKPAPCRYGIALLREWAHIPPGERMRVWAGLVSGSAYRPKDLQPQLDKPDDDEKLNEAELALFKKMCGGA